MITSHNNFPITKDDSGKIRKYVINFNSNDQEVVEESKRVFFCYDIEQARYHICIYYTRNREEDVESFTSYKTMSTTNSKKE